METEINNTTKTMEDMKKPNIAEGNWVIDKFSNGTVSVLYRHDGWADIVADINTKCTSGDLEDNATAISAVPEMIDALCIAYQSMQNLEDKQDLYIPAKTNVKNALQKAGVELCTHQT